MRSVLPTQSGTDCREFLEGNETCLLTVRHDLHGLEGAVNGELPGGLVQGAGGLDAGAEFPGGVLGVLLEPGAAEL